MRMRMRMRTLVGATGVLLLATAANAQDALTNAVRFLVTNQAVQTGDFERDREAAETAHKVLGEFDPDVQKAKIDLSATYTNGFVAKAPR